MPAKRTSRKSKRRKKTTKQRGGAVPWIVDFKKGIEVTKGIANKDVWDFSKAKYDRAKKSYEQMKRQHRKSGSRKSLEQWAKDTGKAKRSDCCIM